MGQPITPETRLNTVLDLHPRMVEYIVALNPHDFARLHNPLMRRLMAPRITVGRLAAMLQMPVAELLRQVAERSGAAVEAGASTAGMPQSSVETPHWVVVADGADVVIVDLLPIDETLDADPLPRVMVAIKALAPGGVVRIKHKWEPQPFYDLWARRGDLEWFARQQNKAEWWIWVRRVR